MPLDAVRSVSSRYIWKYDTYRILSCEGSRGPVSGGVTFET